MAKENNKIGRNSLCPCKSGLKYKYCCISNELRERTIKSDIPCEKCGGETVIDLKDNIMADVMDMYARSLIPIRNFCKDNDIYFFGLLSLADLDEIQKKLASETLTIETIVQKYIKTLTHEGVICLLEDAAEISPSFLSRLKILKDAVEAHFNEKYTLSVPILFTNIEGILREYGDLTLEKKFKPTIPKDIWDGRLLFSMSDSSQYFNAFITKLFEGQQGNDSFNRNPILHGMNVNYDSQEYSTILILVILEIRIFMWFELRTHSFFMKK